MNLNSISRLSRSSKILILILVDYCIFTLCFIFNNYLINLNENLIPTSKIFTLYFLNIFSIFFLFYLFKIYSTIVRYFDINYIVKIFLLLSTSHFFLFLFDLFANFNINFNFYINQIFFSSILIIASRNLILLILNQKKDIYFNDVAIYGAGSAGKDLLANLFAQKNYNIRLFVDDDRNKIGMKISKYYIISRDEFCKTYESLKINLLIIAIPSLSNYDKKKLIEKLSDCKIEIKFLPSLDEILSNKFLITDLKNITFDDFFSNKNNIFDILNLQKFYQNKTVLITGAGGSIGSVIFKKLILFKPRHLLILDKSELNLFNLTKYYDENFSNIKITSYLFDLLNEKKLEDIFKKHKIDYVIHAAAYKHVSVVENNKGYSIYNNFLSTFNLVNTSLLFKVKSLTLISSDKSVYPSNFMGMTKLICEIYFKYISEKRKDKITKMNIVRFGNVFHSSGSVVEIFKKQIEDGGPITISSKKATRYFMSIENACELVLSSLLISNNEKKTNAYVLNMGKPVNILQLASRICKYYGKELKEKQTTNYDKSEIYYTLTGLTKGEKEEESLSYSKLEKTELKNILLDNFNLKNIQNLNVFFDKLYVNITQNELKKSEVMVEDFSKNIDDHILYKK